jgi:hypothetical protein
MKAVTIAIEVDPAVLRRHMDAYLAMLWHLVQANPAPHGDRQAGEVAEYVGREIIRRWLASTEPELWRHQGRDHYWGQLRRFATYEPGSDSFDAGIWVARPAPHPEPADARSDEDGSAPCDGAR